MADETEGLGDQDKDQSAADTEQKNEEAPVKEDEEEEEEEDTPHANESDEDEDEDGEEEEEEEEEEEDDEPKLKYSRMTSQLLSVYRNGDATSTFLVAGDKMIIGTHNGNVHVVSLPSFQPLRVYHAHTASVSSISISPFPPPTPIAVPEGISRVTAQAQQTPKRTPSVTSEASTSATTPRGPRSQVVPNTPSNAIYIATASIDGNVCVQSLVDMKDVQLRNFARPVQAVALSPEYKHDRSYISGGLAGNLVLTAGGRSGVTSNSTTTGTAAATASGWLGSIGLGGNAGKDTILHSGEGAISTIKWSLSGRYVVWINETGVKILRSSLHLESADAESAWKRIGHVDRPHGDGWEEMAGVWKGRAEWIDERTLETDEDDKAREQAATSPATAKLKHQVSKSNQRIEKLLIGWGSTIWIINVHPGGTGVGKHVGERTAGRAEIIKILRMDCIISGLSLYTPTLLIVLAYVPSEDDGEEEEEETPKSPPRKGHKSKASTASTASSEPRGGIRRRQNAQSPELRLIDLGTSQEVDTDALTVSRFERLTATDYHLGVIPAARAPPVVQTSRGTLEAISGMGSGMWNATLNATSLLSSAQSVRSLGSKSDGGSSIKGTPSSTPSKAVPVNSNIATPGMKIFMHSPYDCILATKRDLSDHLTWLVEHDMNREAWTLIDEHPEVISSSPEKLAEIGPGTPDRLTSSHDDFYDEVSSVAESPARLINSSVEKEKRRIGELWIQQLIEEKNWAKAGEVCGKVLGASSRWENWVWTFAGANRFDEIVNFIPTTHLRPALPSTIYEVVLGHYIAHDRPKVRDLLDKWPPDLFDIKSVTTVLENQLKYRDVREDSVEGGEVGRDWRIVMESLAKLHIAAGKSREALKCYFQLHDADTAMTLIKEYHLVDAVSDDIPSFILLRVSKEQLRVASIEELRDVTSEAIAMLVAEAQRGIVRPAVVVEQLEEKKLPLFLFFYIRSLWHGHSVEEPSGENRERHVAESRALIDEFADLAVHLFAVYDRDLLMEFLTASTYYTFEKATQECEDLNYVPELVYLYSKTGQTKRALYLIIDKLGDVSQAINFAKQQDDADLWDDLLNYSMDKPRFIRGLLEEVGTAINPVKLVRKIPEGLEVEGLREGLSRMIKEHELQHSISSGVAKVLQGEVAQFQAALRSGQQKGVRFEVVQVEAGHLHITSEEPAGESVAAEVLADDDPLTAPFLPAPASKPHAPASVPPGHCVGCREPFGELERETLIGFACGHVFHLGHLVSYGQADQASSGGEAPPMVELDENGEFAATHSIGAKVTHARLLRDRIRDGCPLCRG